MNIVFMGTPDFALASLQAIYDGGYTITGVITQPDRPKGRKKTPAPSPVKELALKLGLPVYQPLRLRRNEEALSRIREMSPDLIVVAAFGQIIPKEILEMPGLGCINVHASLLPAYRGAAPIQHAILDGAKETGVTIMRMNEGLDTGDMIAKCIVPISEEETGGSLFDRLAEEGAKLLAETIPHIADGTAVYTPQPEESTTAYAAMVGRDSGRIDWTCGADYICRLIRAMNPWPSAWTTLDGKNLKIMSGRALEEAEAESLVSGSYDAAGSCAPGTAAVSGGKRLLVRCGDGYCEILTLQLEGKKLMKTEDFLRGYRLGEGTVLG